MWALLAGGRAASGDPTGDDVDRNLTERQPMHRRSGPPVDRLRPKVCATPDFAVSSRTPPPTRRAVGSAGERPAEPVGDSSSWIGSWIKLPLALTELGVGRYGRVRAFPLHHHT
jgi:hypothetical protein